MDGKRLRASIALFFTALATSMMLLGSVVPHHHHGAALCFDLSHCREHGAAIPGSHAHPQGHRDCPGASHTDTQAHCTLNLNYYYASQHEEQKHIFCAEDPERDRQPDTFFFFLPVAPLPRVPVLPPRPIERIVHRTDRPKCADAPGRSVGLRAPPAMSFPA